MRLVLNWSLFRLWEQGRSPTSGSLFPDQSVLTVQPAIRHDMSDPTSTVVSRVINAPREAVYRAFPIDLAPVGAIFHLASAPAAAA